VPEKCPHDPKPCYNAKQASESSYGYLDVVSYPCHLFKSSLPFFSRLYRGMKRLSGKAHLSGWIFKNFAQIIFIIFLIIS